MKVIYTTPTLEIPSDDWLGINFGPSKRVMRLIEETYPVISVKWRDGFGLYNVAGGDAFMVPDEDDLLRVEQEHPWVIDVCGQEPLAQFQASYSFMSLCREGQSLNVDRSTYGLKHDAESVCRTYISEGSLIRGALLAGFTLKPLRRGDGYRLNLITDTLYYFLLRVLRTVRDRVESWEPAYDSANDKKNSLCLSH